MFFRKQRITIIVEKIEYESKTHVLVEYDAKNIWLRRTRIGILENDDGSISIELSRRYFDEKYAAAGH